MEDKKKLTYEELENVASQLSSRLQEANKTIGSLNSILNRLPYLFKVVELGSKNFNAVFVSKCEKEIEEIMTIEEEEPKETDK